MATTVTVNPENDEMNKLLDAIEGGMQEVLLQRRGKLVAALVPAGRDKRRESEARADLLAMILQLHEQNRHIPPEEIEAAIDEAVREVRAERKRA